MQLAGSRGLHRVGGDAEEFMWGAGYGVVEGAVEANADPVAAAEGAILGARSEARRMNMDEQLAADRVAQGASEAARLLYPSAEARILRAAQRPLPEDDEPEADHPTTGTV